MGKHCSRFLGNNGCLVIFSGELTDCLQPIEHHDCDELNLIVDFPAKQLNAFEAAHVPVLNAEEDFLL